MIVVSNKVKWLFDAMQIAVDKIMLDNANIMPRDGGSLANSPIYDALLAVKPEGLSLNAWTVKAGVGRSIFTEIRRHGNPTRETLDKLLAAIGLTQAQFEARGAGGGATVRSEVRGTGLSPQQLRDARGVDATRMVPLYGTAYGGDWEEEIELTELHLSEVLDSLARPPSLTSDEDAYAIEIIGDSMHPRFKPGERAFVSPKAAVRPGDDVIVQLTDPEAGGDLERRVTMVLIKELVRRSGTFVELKQYRPEKSFRVPIERVRRIHRVLGRL